MMASLTSKRKEQLIQLVKTLTAPTEVVVICRCQKRMQLAPLMDLALPRRLRIPMLAIACLTPHLMIPRVLRAMTRKKLSYVVGMQT
jgi:hypothetical protein